ncbi:hypothetical protein B0T21DRAFT_414658 [Apiosordaria backusii]|uniref:Uncharacterized protein n=1 Tax=Apiosordaria backusii TaxID=314023 RepID=A0AA40E255_9PEZI|nr:hypothetical protein B0T21DRAFT_414658 [Apiosordaria backusii]
MFTTPIFLAATLSFAASHAADLQTRRVDCETIFTSFSCNTNNFDGLNGVAESHILEEIIQKSDLPNSTFFANQEHVTCLFKDAKFVLDDIEVVPDIDIPGTICVYPDDVPQGGLTLGEIKILIRKLSDECSKCGAISAGHVHSTTVPSSARGYLRIDWRDPPTCREESNCITAKKINETSERKNAEASSSSTGTVLATPSSLRNAAGRVVAGGLGGSNMLFGSLVCLASAFVFGMIAI